MNQTTVMNLNPKVSVIIPNYNHAHFLEKRLQSILKQTYTNFEIICLDDASTDNSLEILEKYLSYSNFKLFPNNKNSGSTFKQWNFGVKQAKGEYIWIAESDDFAHSRFLEKVVAILDENKKAGLAYCQSWLVDYNDRVFGSANKFTDWIDKERWTADFTNSGIDECSNFLIFLNTIPNASAVVFRRKIFLECDGADESMKLAGDWIAWVKILLNSDIAFSSEHLNYFRFHEESVRATSKKKGIDLEEKYRMLEYLLSAIKVSNIARELQCDRLMRQWSRLLIRNRMSLKRNKKIYRIAISSDLQLKRRFFKILFLKFINLFCEIGRHINKTTALVK